jgi:peptidoglycan/xylan/chitin deacetylase (PgdA/CDA1 family)
MKQQILNILKSVLGTLEYRLRPWNYSPNELVVLCMHSTPLERSKQFESLLDFLFKHFKALDPAQLGEYFAGKLQSGPYILFTFDDGLKNNLHAAQLLEARGARAVFFVVPDFVDAANPKEYYLKNIRSKIDARVDHEPEDFTPISIEDLMVLHRKGHCVESHTQSHLLRRTNSAEEIEREIIGSKEWIQRKLALHPTMFCSPIQTNFSVNQLAKQRIDEAYVYHFTTFPGLNGEWLNPRLILRRNIEVHWSLGRVKHSLGKADLARWKGEIERFQQL